jgi:hypothetical protein
LGRDSVGDSFHDLGRHEHGGRTCGRGLFPTHSLDNHAQLLAHRATLERFGSIEQVLGVQTSVDGV